MAERPLGLTIRRRAVTRYLSWFVVAVVVLHLFVRLTDAMDLPGETLWRRLANVDAENTLPTWLSAVMLLVAAALAGLAARHERRSGGRDSGHWTAMSLIVLVLSVDEIASFHEALAGPLRQALGLSGVFYYGWVVPAVAAVVLLAVVSKRFLWRLSPGLRWRLIAAALYFGGAVGMEMVSGLFAGEVERGGWGYTLASTVEETLEMAGVVLLIDTLLLHLTGRVGRIELVLAGDR